MHNPEVSAPKTFQVTSMNNDQLLFGLDLDMFWHLTYATPKCVS